MPLRQLFDAAFNLRWLYNNVFYTLGTLERGDPGELVTCIKYWAIYTCFIQLEPTIDLVLGTLLPFYIIFKYPLLFTLNPPCNSFVVGIIFDRVVTPALNWIRNAVNGETLVGRFKIPDWVIRLGRLLDNLPPWFKVPLMKIEAYATAIFLKATGRFTGADNVSPAVAAAMGNCNRLCDSINHINQAICDKISFLTQPAGSFLEMVANSMARGGDTATTAAILPANANAVAPGSRNSGIMTDDSDDDDDNSIPLVNQASTSAGPVRHRRNPNTLASRPPVFQGDQHQQPRDGNGNSRSRRRPNANTNTSAVVEPNPTTASSTRTTKTTTTTKKRGKKTDDDQS